MESTAKVDKGQKEKSSATGETGKLIRKTSIRRRVSRDESKNTPEIKTYGTNYEDYEKIMERMMLDKGVQNTLEALRERWRMIMFMYTDCMDIVDTRHRKITNNRKRKQRQELLADVILYSAITFPFIILLFIIWIVLT